MTAKYSSIGNHYTEMKKPFPMQTSILIVIAFISFMIFLISLPTMGQVLFCLGLEQGYPNLAYVQSTKVCIDSDTMNYVEIECSGLLRWDCEIISEEKIFRRRIFDDFSDYNFLEGGIKDGNKGNV